MLVTVVFCTAFAVGSGGGYGVGRALVSRAILTVKDLGRRRCCWRREPPGRSVWFVVVCRAFLASEAVVVEVGWGWWPYGRFLFFVLLQLKREE